MSFKIAIIGASYLQAPLIKKAKDMELETHVFAWAEGAIGKELADYFYPISITDKEEILSECKTIGIDGITTIASDLATVAVNYVAHHLKLTGNSLECTNISTNKFKMREAFAKAGIPIPFFMLINSKTAIPDNIKFPAIVKPTDRSGSRGVTRVTKEEELTDAIERAQKESLIGEAIIEEFITGKEISVEFISWQGKHHFLATTDKVTNGEPYFVETEQHQPSSFEADLLEKIKDIVKKALDSLGIKNGASHTELLITETKEIYVVEVGARMGGDNIGAELVPLSTGYDFIKGVVEISLGKEPTVKKNIQKKAGIYYITPQAGSISEISHNSYNGDAAIKTENILQIGDNTHYPVRESGHRAGYIQYQADRKIEFSEIKACLQITTE